MSTTRKPSVLFVDDNPDALAALETIFSDEYDVHLADSGQSAIDRVKSDGEICACVMDVKMAEMDGIQASRVIRKLNPHLPILFHTGYAGEYDEEQIEANEAPFDFIPKGDSITRLIRSVRRGVEMYQLKAGSVDLFSHAAHEYGIITGAEIMAEPLRLIRKAAHSESKVMILGETGTGKELVARGIHQGSCRSKHRYGIYQCSQRSQEMVESELFGHTKGAFTGAIENRVGILEWLDKGTVLMDEIGDLDLSTQTKLLRVIENGEFRQIGSPQDRKIDVRILCATHRNLEQMVTEGTFRQDLLYRLKGIVINLPPLRHRDGDVPLLTRHFLDQYTVGLSLPPKVIDQHAMDLLASYDWPGNIRQLLNVVRTAVETTDSDIILADDMKRIMQLKDSDDHGDSQGLRARERNFRRTCIRDALREANGNIAAAARLLQVDRANLRKWILELDITV